VVVAAPDADRRTRIKGSPKLQSQLQLEPLRFRQCEYLSAAGGKSQSDSNSAQVGYTIGYHRITSIFNVNGIAPRARQPTSSPVEPISPRNWEFSAPAAWRSTPASQLRPARYLDEHHLRLSQAQPNFSVSQTLSASEVLSWVKGKHNLRFGGDYRRVHRDFLGGSNATGSFTFTGLFTEDAAGDQTSGSPIADFLLGLPQSSSIDSSIAKSYLRDNVFDGYAQDDWRAKSSLTLNLGLRWEFFAPYTEKYDHLAFVSTNPIRVSPARLKSPPAALVCRVRLSILTSRLCAARWICLARAQVQGDDRARQLRHELYRGPVLGFATSMAHQPPFANEQTNEEANASGKGSSACAQSSTPTCFTLADGFPRPTRWATTPLIPLSAALCAGVESRRAENAALGIVVNLGYNGSKAAISTSAPRRAPRHRVPTPILAT